MPRKQEETWRRHLSTATRVGTREAGGEGHSIPAVPALTMLAHRDARRVGEVCRLHELTSGREVELSRLQPLFSAPHSAERRPLAEPYMSRKPLRLRPTKSGVELDCSQTSTEVRFDGKVITGQLHLSDAGLDTGIVLLLGNRVTLLLHRLDAVPDHQVSRYGLVGESPALLHLRRQIERVAQLSVPALLLGETGTGKELVAEALHRAGPRRQGPFVSVNLAAVPTTLAAAELFGASRGAYTSADRQREGYFRRADGGTLFLDEIGETPVEVQPLLLRALESGEIQSVGGDRAQRVDVRLLAATDADLDAAVADGAFRAPLLHRLGGCVLRLPPLRQRRDDIGRLLVHFLRQELEDVSDSATAKLRLEATDVDTRPWLPAALVARLAQHDWPGNVRQLRNVARQLAISYFDQSEIQADADLESLLGNTGKPDTTNSAQVETSTSDVERIDEPPMRRAYRNPREVSEDELLDTLRAQRWHPGETAGVLDVSRASLYNLIDACPKTRKAADIPRDELAAAWERCGGDVEAMVDELEVSAGGIERRLRELDLG